MYHYEIVYTFGVLLGYLSPGLAFLSVCCIYGYHFTQNNQNTILIWKDNAHDCVDTLFEFIEPKTLVPPTTIKKVHESKINTKK